MIDHVVIHKKFRTFNPYLLAITMMYLADRTIANSKNRWNKFILTKELLGSITDTNPVNIRDHMRFYFLEFYEIHKDSMMAIVHGGYN